MRQQRSTTEFASKAAEADAAPLTSQDAAGRRAARAIVADYLGMASALVVLVLVFSLLTRHFFSATTFRTIANQIPSAILIATGMTFVLIIAEIDLSVGSVLGLCSAVTGVALVQWHWPIWAAVGCAAAVGAACGGFNGLVTVRWRLPSFIVTLAMLEMARGGAHFLTQSQTQYIGSRIEGMASASVFGLSVPFLVAVLIVIAGQLVLSRTIFGRYAVAIGTNEEAVRLSGIDPRPVKLGVFLLTGTLVALAAVIDTSRFQSANPNAGTGFELQAIAAVVIGGTSLMGGRGSVLSSFFGVLIIAVLNSGLAAVGAKDETKRLITGAVILAAVIVDHYRSSLGKARTEPD
jgi:ribose transport system permease protein